MATVGGLPNKQGGSGTGERADTESERGVMPMLDETIVTTLVEQAVKAHSLCGCRDQGHALAGAAHDIIEAEVRQQTGKSGDALSKAVDRLWNGRTDKAHRAVQSALWRAFWHSGLRDLLKTTPAPVQIIRFNAGNDTNGNPRRVFVAFRKGRAVAAWDEGYAGEQAIPEPLRPCYAGETIDCAPRQYREFRRFKDCLCEHCDREPLYAAAVGHPRLVRAFGGDVANRRAVGSAS